MIKQMWLIQVWGHISLKPHWFGTLPGLVFSAILAMSSSQSVMSSCLKAMLRKCFPPLTFQVPAATRTLEVWV